jgi:hypothetical protein
MAPEYIYLKTFILKTVLFKCRLKSSNKAERYKEYLIFPSHNGKPDIKPEINKISIRPYKKNKLKFISLKIRPYRKVFINK